MGKRIREGVWDCSVCLTKKIPGRQPICACGNIHDSNLKPSEAYYLLQEEQNIVTDPAQLELARSGASWNCGHCGVKNRGTDDTCYECKRPESGDDLVAPPLVYLEGKAADGATFDTPQDVSDDRVDGALEGWGDKLHAGLEDKPFVRPERVLPDSAIPRAATSQYTQYPFPEEDDASKDPHQEDDPPVDETILSNNGRGASLLDLLAPFKGLALFCLAGLIGLLVLFAGGRWIYDEFIATEPVTVTVAAKDWHRQVAVEELKTFREEAWEIPLEGRYVSEEKKFHHNDKVFSHYHEWDEQVDVEVPDGTEEYKCGTTTKDLGNGHFEEEDKMCERNKTKTVPSSVHHKDPVYDDVPVYEEWYTYDIDRWVADHFDSASGDHAVTPYWPEATLHSGQQREGTRIEAYRVVLADPLSRKSNHSLSQPDWEKVAIGMTLEARQTRKGSLRGISWP